MIRTITSETQLREWTTQDLDHRRMLVLMITHPKCGYCHELIAAFPSFLKLPEVQQQKVSLYHFDASNAFVQKLLYEGEEKNEQRLPTNGFPTLYMLKPGSDTLLPIDFYPRDAVHLQEQIHSMS